MNNSRLVYSSGGGGAEYCPTCGLRKSACTCRPRGAGPATRQPSAPNDGVVRLHRDRKGRGGKTVTLITGVRGSGAELEQLASTLKRYCGCGGGVKDGVIEIQGDLRERLAARLTELGYKVKLAGG